ncbi:hypothetical protein Tco_1239839, partial [Tanacetum coccineum]
MGVVEEGGGGGGAVEEDGGGGGGAVEEEGGRGGVMPPKRTSISTSPAMTQAAIRQLVADSITAALEAQAATMASTDNH